MSVRGKGKPAPTVTIKVEPNVPLYPRTHGGQWRPVLFKMQTGESFLVPTDRDRCAVLSAAYHLPINIITRKVNGEGYRIWRVK